jgi:transposase
MDAGDAKKKRFVPRRPRHTLKNRQDAEAVDRFGVKLKILKAQAEAGDIDLLFQDESEASTHPYLFRTWARRGEDLRIEAPGQAKRRAILGALDHGTGQAVVLTSATKRSTDFIGLLEKLDAIYGTTERTRPLKLVIDNGPIHTSKASMAALAARPWITPEWMPKYAPELNAIERFWLNLKRWYLAHRTFASADDLDAAIHAAVAKKNGSARPSKGSSFLPCPA